MAAGEMNGRHDPAERVGSDVVNSMTGSEKQRLNIQDFIEGLKSLPHFTAAEVYGYLKLHPVDPESLKPFLFFSSVSYTRNLIFKNDLFELLALCWESGQVSRIHNHRDQQCWMTVPIGMLQAQDFRVRDRNEELKTCRLVPIRTYPITPERPAEVNMNQPVHQVLNLPGFRARAVSLHIYSKPFDTCEVYFPDNGNYADVPLHYTSEYGRLCEGEPGSLAG
jgi:cysteine dioxygenase